MYNRCNNCGYGKNLIFIPNKNYSLCTEYPFDVSCYDKANMVCSFCKSHSNNFDIKQIDDDIELDICNKCNNIYKAIVLWNYDALNSRDEKCVFCSSYTENDMYQIKRYEYNEIYFCSACYTNYNYLIK